ncbi:hypothetical protein V5T82_16980 [Magnetovibrio sp. PR-2]|uniref:hypothetical protein n=1 Tax=Magnetovibrio sp. PR-2 TaxID=3120356 RepID=UPI002FCE24A8
MKQGKAFSIFIGTCLMAGCSAGDMRMFGDTMSSMNGNEVTYPDQSNVQSVGDVKLLSGIKNGSGFLIIDNMGETYCRVRVTFEDGTKSYFNLDPGEDTGLKYMSVYNQGEHMRTICTTSSWVFSASFNDE